MGGCSPVSDNGVEFSTQIDVVGPANGRLDLDARSFGVPNTEAFDEGEPASAMDIGGPSNTADLSKCGSAQPRRGMGTSGVHQAEGPSGVLNTVEADMGGSARPRRRMGTSGVRHTSGVPNTVEVDVGGSARPRRGMGISGVHHTEVPSGALSTVEVDVGGSPTRRQGTDMGTAGVRNTSEPRSTEGPTGVLNAVDYLFVCCVLWYNTILCCRPCGPTTPNPGGSMPPYYFKMALVVQAAGIVPGRCSPAGLPCCSPIDTPWDPPVFRPPSRSTWAGLRNPDTGWDPPVF